MLFVPSIKSWTADNFGVSTRSFYMLKFHCVRIGCRRLGLSLSLFVSPNDETKTLGVALIRLIQLVSGTPSNYIVQLQY